MRGMEWKRTWGWARSQGGRVSHPWRAQAAAAMVTSASCLIHLKQQKEGGEAPSLATAAWGCLQQPLAGFPERDSKPDILRLQNTQVSRAKNSCHPAPARGRGAGLLRRLEGQLRSHPASCWRTAAGPAEPQAPRLRLTGGLCRGSPTSQAAHPGVQPLPPWAAGPEACTVSLALGC